MINYNIYETLAIARVKEFGIEFIGFIKHCYKSDDYVVNTNIGVKIVTWVEGGFEVIEFNESHFN
jgi:hypothetical protein